MSFNVLSDAHFDRHVGPWEERRDAVAACIHAFAPDLLGTQEVMGDQAGDLRRLLPEYERVGAGRLDGREEGEQTAIFFRRDRFEKLAEGHFWLSETPDTPGTKDWLSPVPRTCSWVRLRDRQRPERVLYHFNTHLDPISMYARAKSADLLRERIRDVAGPDPVVLTGDFNAPAGRLTYGRLLGEEGDALRLIDSYRSVYSDREGNEGTYHVPGGLRLWRRIDWILHTDHFRATAAGIETGRFRGRWPSDHCAVTAVLEMQAETPGPYGSRPGKTGRATQSPSYSFPRRCRSRRRRWSPRQGTNARKPRHAAACTLTPTLSHPGRWSGDGGSALPAPHAPLQWLRTRKGLSGQAPEEVSAWTVRRIGGGF
jgi:endonuclease/exonuclease/phosphatase family metal-dependent hydrolase